ncbi:MAG TPA: hypothetical protein VMF86_19300 [Stellaceae bacterium]|jgi:hypothetical protein|nr:hypothetical protein [Stellaceae bacterium]
MARDPVRKRPFVKDEPTGTPPGWERDGLDAGWLYSTGIGAIRSARSYKPGGWWFLPAWLPDTAMHDVGPFPTRSAAITAAEEMALRANKQ